ncbi:hypothetical protein B0H65DRAFT_477668 [Neurospora tetraspora]|uniref:Secreted protein n=1 Tax=Neurospora tetraspora TaxID=94610 RepID=A0AAE0J896_9PEZI|nr:hypothetical protein B0H65DRAFT_477668 [Neurospora tetraspora]
MISTPRGIFFLVSVVRTILSSRLVSPHAHDLVNRHQLTVDTSCGRNSNQISDMKHSCLTASAFSGDLPLLLPSFVPASQPVDRTVIPKVRIRIGFSAPRWR